ncbi:MAG: M23 family metallopeptidase [Balneolaceae bacterium]|nr:M23 family metallopeptidase [Balneolaceae bacterium]
MLKFIQKLFEQRNKRITLILLDDSKPGEDNSYVIEPKRFFMLIIGGSLLIVGVISLFFMLTPLGGLLYSSDQADIRKQILDITERTVALEDSLRRREIQLEEMKNVIRLSVDTTLNIDQRLIASQNENRSRDPVSIGLEMDESADQINQYEILAAGMLESAPMFPARYPLQGTISRSYKPEERHFGIDIATKEGETVTNVASGAVVNSGWTMNYGYVISIQHKDGVLTTYKHLTKLNKKEGDIVLKGDLLGTAGDIGVLSSGSHLHFEIWKNGVSQNPELYLIK